MVGWNGCTGYVGVSHLGRTRQRFHSTQLGEEIRKPIQMGITGFEGVLESVSKGKSMNRKMVKTITLRTFALVAVLCAARSGRAADATTPYPSMAPLGYGVVA